MSRLYKIEKSLLYTLLVASVVFLAITSLDLYTNGHSGQVYNFWGELVSAVINDFKGFIK